MEARSAIGHGIKDGTSSTGRDISMDKPFVLQWYWQEALMYPYRKSKAWYHGPREKWMNLVEKEMSKCSCGRSPTGLCIGWHALTKEDYEKKKKKYEELPEEKQKTAFHARAIDGMGE